MSNFLKDIKLSVSLLSISLVVSIVKSTFSSLSSKSSSGVLKFLLVLRKSSLLVNKSSFDFREFVSVSSEFFFSIFSQGSNFDHKIIEVNLGLDFSFNVIIKESGEINLELFKKSDAFVKSSTIKRGSNFNKSLDWVRGTNLRKFNESFSSSVWGNGFKLGNDNFKSIEDEFGLFLSSKEIFTVFGSLSSSSNFLLMKHNKHLFTSINVFDELSLSASKRFDSLSSFLDFISSMRNSGVVVFN